MIQHVLLGIVAVALLADRWLLARRLSKLEYIVSELASTVADLATIIDDMIDDGGPDDDGDGEPMPLAGNVVEFKRAA